MIDDVLNLFTREHGVYKNIFKFQTILVFITILVVLTKFDFFSGRSVYILLALALALFVSDLFVKVAQDDLSDSNKVIYFKLQTLQSKVYQYIQYKIDKSSVGGQKLSSKDMQTLYQRNKLDSLYIDANLIEFFYSIIKLYDYNPAEFYLLLKGTNNLLKLRNEVEIFYKSEDDYPENIHEMMQIAINLKANCMNNIQNFIYSVPKTKKMYKYIDNIIEAYNVLINQSIRKMQAYNNDYIRKHGVNNSSIFINITSTKPYDTVSNHSVIPGKQQNKHSLIDLYV